MNETSDISDYVPYRKSGLYIMIYEILFWHLYSIAVERQSKLLLGKTVIGQN